jgi:hypothetical protein
MKTATAIKFIRSDNEWFETDLDSLGIDQTIINHYGTLEFVLDDVIKSPEFVENNYISYEIIWRN